MNYLVSDIARKFHACSQGSFAFILSGGAAVPECLIAAIGITIVTEITITKAVEEYEICVKIC